MVSDKDKIEILLRENQNIRTELTAFMKNIHNCFFSFLASLGIFTGILINMSLQNDCFIFEEDLKTGVITFIISQIEYIIVVFSINMQADVNIKASYISYLERKINKLAGEELIFWESRISKNMWISHIFGKYKNMNSLISSLIVLNAFYVLAFISLVIFTYIALSNILVLVFYALEIIVIIYLLISLKSTYSEASIYINTIHIDDKSK